MEGVFNNGFVNAIINTYLLGLGEFSIDDFKENTNERTIWLIFLFSTFIIMIVFLNMIIAIMGNSYDKVSRDWERSALIEKTSMYADFMILINEEEIFKNN